MPIDEQRNSRSPPFIRSVVLVRDRIDVADEHPFSLPAIESLDSLSLSTVTYLVGENGTGKSTLLEAVAVAAGFNPEGGTVNMRFATRPSESRLHRSLQLVRTRRPKTGFFLRAESFFNVATEIERLGVGEFYGERSLHEQSHGESVLSLIQNRFGPHGLYILDEPESALSPSRQLALLMRMHELVREGSQFIIATHSPIVLAYPEATIYQLDANGINSVSYEETELVSLTRDFLVDRDRYLRRLLG